MIQSVIDGIGKNSFSLKGWAVGVMIAIYAFAGQNYNKAVIVTLIPLIIFWILDSYYLMLERKYRRLYNDYPVEEWHGGKVHKIRDSVLHLMRGEIFDIDGKKFFAFGGAKSHNIQVRKVRF